MAAVSVAAAAAVAALLRWQLRRGSASAQLRPYLRQVVTYLIHAMFVGHDVVSTRRGSVLPKPSMSYEGRGVLFFSLFPLLRGVLLEPGATET